MASGRQGAQVFTAGQLALPSPALIRNPQMLAPVPPLSNLGSGTGPKLAFPLPWWGQWQGWRASSALGGWTREAVGWAHWLLHSQGSGLSLGWVTFPCGFLKGQAKYPTDLSFLCSCLACSSPTDLQDLLVTVPHVAHPGQARVSPSHCPQNTQAAHAVLSSEPDPCVLCGRW